MLLAGIMLLALLLRLPGFPNIPNELNRDEAALGYNAYALLTTRADEHYETFPFVFQSFGDYKLPGFIYLLLPFIAQFGRTALAVRLPSLIAGVMLVPAGYVFVQSLFEKKQKQSALWTAFFVAVSPWAIHYARLGFEANVALTLMVFGAAFLLQKKQNVLKTAFGILLYLFAAATYNTPMLLAPIVLFVLFLLKRRSLISLSILFVLLAGIFFLELPATKGKTGITFLSDQTMEYARKDKRLAAKNIVERILSNPYVYYPTILAQQYIETYSPVFLVLRGGANPWHQASKTSHLTWPEYILLLLSIGWLVYTVFKEKRFSFGPNRALLFLILYAPLPSAVTVDAPHATRSLFLFFLFCVVMGVFVTRVVVQHRQKILLTLFILAGTLVYVYTAQRTLQNIPQPEWQVGMRSAILQAVQMKKDGKGNTVVLLGNKDFDYIYYKFYSDDPQVQFMVYEEKEYLSNPSLQNSTNIVIERVPNTTVNQFSVHIQGESAIQ
jgi:4-amino-4-deoxy-L-arabinose transferase-like glycosyltransferase